MQFGIQPKYSVEAANCYMVEKIRPSLDKGGVVGAVFLDLRKAFDTVNHKVLIDVLSKFNFSETIIKLIRSYLTDRTQSVKVNNQISTAHLTGSHKGPYLDHCYSAYTLMNSHQFVTMLISNCAPIILSSVYMVRIKTS